MFHQLASNYVNNLQSSGQSDLFMLIFVTLINSIHTISVDQNGPKRDQHVNLKDHDYRHLILSSSSSSSNRHQPADIHHHSKHHFFLLLLFSTFFFIIIFFLLFLCEEKKNCYHQRFPAIYVVSIFFSQKQ